MLDDIRNCRLCEFRGNCDRPLIPSGYLNAKIMAVNLQPSTEETVLDQLFGDRDGRLVRKELTDAFGKENLYFTSLLKCPSFKVYLNKQDLHVCPWLQKEIESLKPKLIFTFGEKVFKTLTKVKFDENLWGVYNGFACCPSTSTILNSKKDFLKFREFINAINNQKMVSQS